MALIDYLTILEQYTPNKWAYAGSIILVFIALAFLTYLIIDLLIRYAVRFTDDETDDQIIHSIRKPLLISIILLGVKNALVPLQINGSIQNIVASLAAITFIYLLGAVVNTSVKRWGMKYAKSEEGVNETLVPLIRRTVNVIFILIAIIWTLRIWKIDVTPYLAGLGIGGAIIGLAFQDTLKNILGGAALVLDKNFHLKDIIKLESGEVGEVEDVGLRSTRIKTFDNEIIFVPNGQLANSRIQNYAEPNTRRRVVVKFGIEYGSNVEKAREVVIDTLKNMDEISDDPYMDVVFTEMGDSSLNMQARFWVEHFTKERPKRWEATEKIYKRLREEGIGIAFPTREIYLNEES